jgi:hypothetical protein
MSSRSNGKPSSDYCGGIPARSHKPGRYGQSSLTGGNRFRCLPAISALSPCYRHSGNGKVRSASLASEFRYCRGLPGTGLIRGNSTVTPRLRNCAAHAKIGNGTKANDPYTA